MNADLGFKGDQVIAVTFYSWDQKDRHAYYESALNKIKPIKGVEAAAGTNMTMGFGAPQSSPIHYLDKIAQSRIVYTEYDLLKMLDVQFLEGRDFDRNITSDSINNVILNETAIKSLGIEDPINKTIKWNNEMYTIIGVIKDMNSTGFSKTTTANLYIRAGSKNYIRNNIQNIFIKISAEDMEQTIARIEQLWTSSVDQNYPFEYEFIDKQFAKTYANYIQQRNLFGILNIVVVSIALFGLFALSSFSVERRLKEVAIKKTLGAETSSIIKDLSQRYIWICLIGFVLALIPSYYIIQEWLSNFAYRTEIEPMLFVLSFVLMILFTLIIVISKSYAASRLNPIKYLKYE
jgi:putative ABC transport system permease protein